MKFAHLLSRVTGTPWLITDDALANITALLEARINGISIGPRGEAESPNTMTAAAGTAVVPLFGMIGKRISQMEADCGGVDIDAMERAFDAANNDAAVERIVLHIHSPGGTVTGVPELAQKIYDRKRKPVMAVSDTLMASAAYYIASAADEIVVTPTANVGSIGVVSMVRESLSDTSADGKTRLRIFRSGTDKAMGAAAPLTEDQAKAIDERVQFLGAMFRTDVTKARPNVKAESMTGLVYFGEDAVTRGLADRVVPNLAEALS